MSTPRPELITTTERIDYYVETYEVEPHLLAEALLELADDRDVKYTFAGPFRVERIGRKQFRAAASHHQRYRVTPPGGYFSTVDIQEGRFEELTWVSR